MTHQAPIILMVGTRPEGIKMIPLYKALRAAGYNTLLCSTSQHAELLDEVFTLFEVRPDFELHIMQPGQDLFHITQSVLQKTKEFFVREKPSLVIVQGDTTSTMAAALSAFYLRIPVVHIEAGLRTGDIASPFPEEMNRQMVGLIADYHCAPTATAAANLLAQGVDRSRVFCTGNTVVDALRLITEKINAGSLAIRPDVQEKIAQHTAAGRKILLLTAHRRESFDGGIERILTAVKEFLLQHNDVVCFYARHPNPYVTQAIEKIDLANIPNMILCDPLSYKDMVYVLNHANVVLTDSGGIQEEAVSLGKTVLVLREKTERMEGVWAGIAHLVGTDSTVIMQTLRSVIDAAPKNAQSQTIYGDGYACEKIIKILQTVGNHKPGITAQHFNTSVRVPAKRMSV